MTKARTLDQRRKSIRNIRKITRTMELISTARFRRAMDRAVEAAPYAQHVAALVAHVAQSGAEIRHPLLETRDPPGHATLLVLSANRGLCGGYNAAVTRLARARWEQLRETVPSTRLEVSGKRGASALRFRKIQPDETFTHFEDKPAFDEVEVLADRYLSAYRAGGLDRLEVVYTRFVRLGRQEATVETLLPIRRGESPKGRPSRVVRTEYEFLPSPESILDEVVPTSFKVKLFQCFLDAAISEQIARMMAMKAATENADSMIEHLTMTYNRVRQNNITSELLEVIGGADALDA
jgi:F-type H+-transporting ATPase subunit gamma